MSAAARFTRQKTKMPQPKKKRTREEILARKRENERKRYERIKNDPDKLAALNEKKKQYSLKTRNTRKIKTISEMTDCEKMHCRKLWRARSRKYSRKKKAAKCESDSPIKGSVGAKNQGLASENIDAESQIQDVQENSDDDVIEVVRDEAPIEILSDGEELEIQLQQSQDALKSIQIENVEVGAENPRDEDKEKVDASGEDPLKNSDQDNFCSDLMNALNPPGSQDKVHENFVPTEAEFNTKLTLDSNQKNSNDLNKDITNVLEADANTKIDQPESILPDSGLIEIKARMITHEGRSVLVVNNHRYAKQYTSRGGRTRWRCCRCYMKCLATAITYQNQIVKLNANHNHEETMLPERIIKKETDYHPFIPSVQYADSEQKHQPRIAPAHAPMPTLEISPLIENSGEKTDIKERIVVMSRQPD